VEKGRFGFCFRVGQRGRRWIHLEHKTWHTPDSGLFTGICGRKGACVFHGVSQFMETGLHNGSEDVRNRLSSTGCELLNAVGEFLRDFILLA
jgi:hypothetical protein